jgi:hypothetical protein
LDIARIQQQIAATSIYGNLAAIDEFRKMNSLAEEQIMTLRKQLQLQNEQLSRTVKASYADKMAAFQTLRQIKGLELTIRQGDKAIRDAYLTGMVGDLFGSGGAFEKIIIQNQRNYAAGLTRGLISPNIPKEIVGSIGQTKGIKPITIQQIAPQVGKLFSVIEDRSRMRRTPPSMANKSAGVAANMKVARKALQNCEDMMEELETDFYEYQARPPTSKMLPGNVSAQP